jgi:DNA-binding CsgD family transcriptional regulator
LKTTPPARLLESVKEAAAGGASMSPEAARRVIDPFRQFRPPAQDACSVTAQEMRLLKLLGEGHHYKTASAEMGISVHTVGFHMRRIYEKLQVHSKSEAVAKAFREGLFGDGGYGEGGRAMRRSTPFVFNSLLKKRDVAPGFRPRARQSQSGRCGITKP